MVPAVTASSILLGKEKNLGLTIRVLGLKGRAQVQIETEVERRLGQDGRSTTVDRRRTAEERGTVGGGRQAERVTSTGGRGRASDWREGTRQTDNRRGETGTATGPLGYKKGPI